MRKGWIAPILALALWCGSSLFASASTANQTQTSDFYATLHGQPVHFHVVVKPINPSTLSLRPSFGSPAVACNNPAWTVGGCATFGPYSCGSVEGFDTTVDEYGPEVHVWLNSENYSYVCHYAWNHWVDAGCASWGGTCAVYKGVLDNYTWTVNPWGNYVWTAIGGAGQDTYYCRHYQNAGNYIAINWWCD